ncbi:hypothetical protein UP10_12425 [Bradyrhizobium sp. LTSPM299]|jgi:hypothetical protein|uniref:hypothetical protein n=1 Tax=Bradyrhizobium sp. LTSPM299 TaxID=1619233 RepID=UPI0005E537FD|nr:hypothetical protein [Bradyrhizobium sp. LTSPM299]KJC60431.1 hypothetical protein UP10_12425 [Bradyrhizobium sp. LTSPM299]
MLSPVQSRSISRSLMIPFFWALVELVGVEQARGCTSKMLPLQSRAETCMYAIDDAIATNAFSHVGRPPILRVQSNGLENLDLAYFMEDEPRDLTSTTLPADAQDVLAAKVHLTQSVWYMGDSFTPPPPNASFETKLKILSVLRGKRLEQSEIRVTFGPFYRYRKNLIPITPDQLARDYFVIVFSDSDGLHLAGIPVGWSKSHEWQRQILDYEIDRTPTKK